MPVHYFDPNGVDSLRNNGYRDTAMALSELIDNSIQAEATKVEIGLIAKLSDNPTRREWLVNEIYISDNGIGMDKATVETSLRFGGGTRHGASRGLGKFGMGLPNSSASQCPRFEVYSWKNKSEILYNYFDFNEIRSKKSEFLPEVIQTELPEHISKLNSIRNNSGTIIRWVNCDKLILRRASKLVPHICFPLGRIFRYFINDNKIEIVIRVFEENGKGEYSEKNDLKRIVKAVDPLFLMSNTQLPEPFNLKPTNTIWDEGEFLFPDPKGDKQNKELYEKIGDSIKLKFSIAKSETKRLGGSSKLGEIYRQFIGISVIRAGREIKLDNFGFIGELGDPMNRWWKVELSFEPKFDSYFGLDNTKQNVHAFKKIMNKDELYGYEDEIQLDFICKLSQIIEDKIKRMRSDLDAIDAGSRGGIKGRESSDPNEPMEEDNPFPQETYPVPLPSVDLESNETDEEKEELKTWLLTRYPEYVKNTMKLKLAVDWFFKTEYNQVIVFSQLGAASFYEFQSIGHKVIIEINTEHEFYLEFMRPIFEEKDINKIDQLLILFGSMVEAEKELVSYSQYISKFRTLFAFKLSQFIFDWKESK